MNAGGACEQVDEEDETMKLPSGARSWDREQGNQPHAPLKSDGGTTKNQQHNSNMVSVSMRRWRRSILQLVCECLRGLERTKVYFPEQLEEGCRSKTRKMDVCKNKEENAAIHLDRLTIGNGRDSRRMEHGDDVRVAA